MSEGEQWLDLSRPYGGYGTRTRAECVQATEPALNPIVNHFQFQFLLFALNTHPTTSTASTTPRITANSAYIHRKLCLLPSQKEPGPILTCTAVFVLVCLTTLQVVPSLFFSPNTSA